MLDTATIVAELEAERDRLDSAIAALQGSQGSRIRVATGRADGRGHKAKIHQKIVEDASECVRAECLSGAAVSAVMRDTGLTHGGFYKHFRSKDDLLLESLSEAFRDFTDTLVRAAEQSPSGEAWKAIVKTYLRPEMYEHPERGCPLAALAPELARVDKRMKPQIVTELVNYKSRMVPFIPGRRIVDKERAFFAIFQR